MTKLQEQWEAPDGSLLITRELAETATLALHISYRHAWPYMGPRIRRLAAATCFVLAMGYQKKEAPREVVRLLRNHWFVHASEALVYGYQVVRDEGLA